MIEEVHNDFSNSKQMGKPFRSIQISASALRMRRLRERQRNKLRVVELSIHESTLESLEKLGYLPLDRRDDREAITAALTIVLRGITNAASAIRSEVVAV